MAKNIKDGISISYDDYTISFSPLSISKQAENINKSGDIFEYSKTFGTNAAIQYTPLYSGIKEDIILYEYNEVNEFKFSIKTNGLTMKQDDYGNIYLVERSML